MENTFWLEEPDHDKRCEAQPIGKECICLELKQEDNDIDANNQIDDYLLNL